MTSSGTTVWGSRIPRHASGFEDPKKKIKLRIEIRSKFGPHHLGTSFAKVSILPASYLTISYRQQDVEDWNAPTEDQGYESDNEFEDEDENEDDSNRRRGHFFSGGRRHKGRHSIGRSSG